MILSRRLSGLARSALLLCGLAAWVAGVSVAGAAVPAVRKPASKPVSKPVSTSVTRSAGKVPAKRAFTASAKPGGKPSVRKTQEQQLGPGQGGGACARRARSRRAPIQDGRHRGGRPGPACGGRDHLQPADTTGAVGIALPGQAVDCQHHEGDDRRGVYRERPGHVPGGDGGPSRRRGRVDDHTCAPATRCRCGTCCICC